MRIGIITDAIDDKAAGIGTYVRNLVPNIIKLDKDNEYYLIHHDNSRNDFYEQFKHDKKVHEIIIPIGKIPFAREIRKIFSIPKILDSYELALVHETAQIGPFFTKTKYEKIVTVHDIAPIIIPKIHSKLVYLHHLLGLPITFRNVDKIIAVSEATKKDIINNFKVSSSKIKTILEAQDGAFREIGHPEIQKIKKQFGLNKYFLFVGSIEPRKNLERVLNAFNSMKTNSEIQFVIVTKKGWKNKKVLEIIEKSENIMVLNNISKKSLIGLYSGAKATVFVSLYEGFGLPILEANACGCPVITSNTSSMPEIAGKAALIVNPLKTEEIRLAMEKIITNKTIGKRLRRYGLNNVKKYSWIKAAKMTIETYKEAAKKAFKNRIK